MHPGIQMILDTGLILTYNLSDSVVQDLLVNSLLVCLNLLSLLVLYKFCILDFFFDCFVLVGSYT